MSELDLFYYTTHQWDKGAWVQDFALNILWENETELYGILAKLGVEPEIHDVIDEHTLEDLDDDIFQQATRLQNILEKMDFRYRRPDPGWDKRYYVSRETHPELWES